MAGESARAVARARREKAERLVRSAESYERGALGEELTAQALKSLAVNRWQVLHDVRWPGRRYANIDHVVVGPGGVFVIDSKHWSGAVRVVNDVLLQSGRKRETAVAAVAGSAIAVAELVPGLDPGFVRPVLCFVRDEPLAGCSRGVLVCSTANLVELLASRHEILTDEQVRSIFDRLADVLRPTTTTLSKLTARAMPRPRSRVPAGSRRRKGRAKPTGFSALGGLLIIIGVLAFAPQLVGSLAEAVPAIVHDRDAPSQLGDMVAVAAVDGRPALEFTVRSVTVTEASGPGVRAGKGNRLMAVSVRIVNTGERDWRLRGETKFSLTDYQYRTYSPVVGLGQVTVGNVLPARVKLGPGKTIEGVVVFAVPRRADLRSVIVRVGPGSPEMISWPIRAKS